MLTKWPENLSDFLKEKRICELDIVLPQAEFFKQDPDMATPLGE